MKDKRQGNDLKVAWSIFMQDGEPFRLDGKDVSLYLKNMFGRKELNDFVTSGNIIQWTFYGKDQKNSGKYSLELVINEGEKGMITTDKCDFINLVSCSCKLQGGEDAPNVETESIELTSTLEYVAGGGDYDDTALWKELENKVDKVEGLGLSEENYTTEDKEKLAGLENYDDSDVRKLISQKQDTITDLVQIREGARLGSTALQEHQDVSHLAEKSEVEKVAEDVTKHGQDIVALQTLAEEQGALVQESNSRLDVLEPNVTELKGEVETLTGTGEGSVVDIVNKEVAKVVDSAPETMDTLKKIADLIEKDAEQAADILVTLGDHEARIGTLENKFVVLSETEYENLDKKEDKFYFCYEE